MHPKKKKANVKFNGIWLSSEESMSVYFAGTQFVERRCKTSVIATALFWHTAQSVFIHMFVFNFYDSHPSAWVEIIKERSEWSVCGNIIRRRRRRRTLMLEVFDVVSTGFIRLCVISVHIAGPWPAESDIKCDGVAKHIPIIAWMSDLMLIKALFLVALTKNYLRPPPPHLFSMTRPVVIWFTGYEALQRVAEMGRLSLCAPALLFMAFLKFTLVSVYKQGKNG